MHISPFILFHFTHDFLCSCMLKNIYSCQTWERGTLSTKMPCCVLLTVMMGLPMLALSGCRFIVWHFIIIWKITIPLLSEAFSTSILPMGKKIYIGCFPEMPLSLHTTIYLEKKTATALPVFLCWYWKVIWALPFKNWQ